MRENNQPERGYMSEKGLSQPLGRVLFWISMALLFCGVLWRHLGSEKALEFLGGYLIELSLSIDNLFVFIMIFAGYGLSESAQRRALNYGIAGAIILRFIFIFFGVQLVHKFEWLLYIFGVILILNGLSMLKKRPPNIKPGDGRIIRFMRKCMPMTPGLVGNKFFVRQGGKLYATPLLGVVILIELIDVLFAMDSVPAIFSITTDLAIVYTSNVFAILGLRQLYFVLYHLHSRFIYVKYGVALLLIFTGTKLGIAAFDIYISNAISILFIVTVLVLSIVISITISGTRKNI